MNKTLLSAALMAGVGIAAFAPQAANASDGTITFTGKVLSSTCVVQNSGAVAVTLPDVQKSAFTAAGSVAGLTAFTIGLTGCPTTPTGVLVGASFDQSTVDATTGAINNTVGATYSNVEVQMTNAAGAAMDLRTAVAPAFAINSSGVATLSYKAQYYQPTATAITAGLVSAVQQFTVTYN